MLTRAYQVGVYHSDIYWWKKISFYHPFVLFFLRSEQRNHRRFALLTFCATGPHSVCWGPFYLGLSWISAWIRIYMPSKVCGVKLLIPFPNFNGGTQHGWVIISWQSVGWIVHFQTSMVAPWGSQPTHLQDILHAINFAVLAEVPSNGF